MQHGTGPRFGVYMPHAFKNRPTEMTSDRKFILRLSAALAVKFLLLAGLWFVFVRDNRVSVDASHVESLIFPRH
jgi:hypothetical protein